MRILTDNEKIIILHELSNRMIVDSWYPENISSKTIESLLSILNIQLNDLIEGE